MGAGEQLLALSAISALNTANAIRPYRRHGLGSVMSFAAGWVTSEMPLHAIGWEVLATAGLAGRGALRSRSGRAGLAITALSFAGLVEVHRQAQRSTRVIDNALVEGLGWPSVGVPAAPPRLRQVVAPALVDIRHRSVRNLTYGEAGRRNMLDVWRRADLAHDAGAPVLLQIHGGAWVTGNKDSQGLPLMAHMAEHGWVCVAINYRLSPRATWPDHIVDVKRAIAWIRSNIIEHGGDPGFVAVTGGSAGGHLAALAALSANDAEFQPGFEDADTRVQAAVPFYGVYDLTNRGKGPKETIRFLERAVMKSRLRDDPHLWSAASPVERVRADAPPFFVLHGANDSLVPVEEARLFVEQLRARSARPVVYAEIPVAQHAFDSLATTRTAQVVRGVHRFLETTRSRVEPSGAL